MVSIRSAAVSGRPSRTSAPASGGRTPPRHSNSVVFPEPFGPITPSTSPDPIENETPESALTRPYCFETCATCSTRPPIVVDSQLDHGNRVGTSNREAAVWRIECEMRTHGLRADRPAHGARREVGPAFDDLTGRHLDQLRMFVEADHAV